MSDGTDFELPEDAPATPADAAPADENADAAAAPAEATEQNAEADAAAAKAAAAAELKQAVDNFVANVNAAVAHEGRDDETGHLPEAAIAPVKVAFSQLPNTRAKTLCANFLRDSMTKAMLEDEDALARSISQLYKAVNSIVAVKKEAAIRIPVDPNQAHAEAVVALALAANLVVPAAGVTTEAWKPIATKLMGELKEDSAKYYEWLTANAGKSEEERAAAPEVNAIVVKAASIANRPGVKKKTPKTPANSGGTGSGRGRPVGSRNHSMRAHLLEFFAGKDENSFATLEEIASFKSNEYGDDPVHKGAIVSHLVPPSGKASRSVDFARLVNAGEDGRAERGVLLTATTAGKAA